MKLTKEAEESKRITITDKSDNKLSGVVNMTSKQFWHYEKSLRKKMHNSTINKIDADWKKGTILIEQKLLKLTKSKLREIILEEYNNLLKEALPHNKNMQDFLAKNGIKANVKRIDSGSLKGTWRLYGKGQKWTPELQNKLTKLGFKGFDGKPLNKFSGNGGFFSVFVIPDKNIGN